MIARFEMVSFERFAADMAVSCPELSPEQVRAAYEGIRLPKRATTGSAGYDFMLPYDLTLKAGEGALVPTGIRAWMRQDYVLLLMPRSSLGFKFRLQLDNTVGVIDSDYYGSDNEGHIRIKITNDSREAKTLELKAGAGLAQGIFLPYGTAEEEEVTRVRNGGLGSTDK
ncbi:MAG: deoxyuridine 5'-triphosphate nucleotidohydrolase [Lachnospiraceae bacterium]|nr:deoxyuridine 5'-triphosphate nucleotidohydrolase [Lachnospiraceae bacterium]